MCNQITISIKTFVAMENGRLVRIRNPCMWLNDLLLLICIDPFWDVTYASWVCWRWSTPSPKIPKVWYSRANRSTRNTVTELKIKYSSPGILTAILTIARGNLDKVPYTCNTKKKKRKSLYSTPSASPSFCTRYYYRQRKSLQSSLRCAHRKVDRNTYNKSKVTMEFRYTRMSRPRRNFYYGHLSQQHF